ncbi:MAG: RsmE family RNA methyltransferase [Planctomycetota bacterium]
MRDEPAPDPSADPAAEAEGPNTSRRFVLVSDPRTEVPRLVDEDVQHALRVLRVSAGERITGLDGRGAAWPLEVLEVSKRALVLRLAGEPAFVPAPGAGPTPSIEVAWSLPRGSRAEDSVGRLTQLGAQRFTPLLTHRTPPHAREAGEARRSRLARAAREAAKQCGRLWFPDLSEPTPLTAWLAARAGTPIAWLDPYAPASLLAWDAPRTARCLALAIGPEGGFTPDEEALLAAHGAFRARLGGHVLRLETAAEAALAVIATMALPV